MQSVKAQPHEVGGHAAKDQTQIQTLINHTGSINMKCCSRD